MRISFYAPFKPLGHAHPSGDLVIGTGLFEYLQNRGHQLMVASDCRARWIYWTPWRWPELLRETLRAAGRVRQFAPDIWLTYHAYYKAPDLLGPSISKRLDIPYVIFQGAFATKTEKKNQNLAGIPAEQKIPMRRPPCFQQPAGRSSEPRPPVTAAGYQLCGSRHLSQGVFF